MNDYQCQVKESMIRGLKETLHPNVNSLEPNRSSAIHLLPQSSLENEVLSKHFSKSIKLFVEHSLLNDISSHITQIENANKETWKIDAYNVSKALVDQSKLSCMQENLSNILDTCLKEFDGSSVVQYLNDTDIDISPLLQPEHVIEIAECMSVEKPLDVRLNALRILSKSHFTEAVNGEGWTLLQKNLVDSLCDSNIEIFITCLKAHAKLASCSSPVAIKECSLNLIESLGRHYYLHQTECKIASFQNMHFHRMVYLVYLLLHTFKEASGNIARFGESRLQEMIENLVQLMSISVSSKQSRNKSFPSPLEVVSFVDPNAKWLANLIHFNLSRQLFFSSLHNNISFMRICVEEILCWIAEPVIPSKHTSKINEGELNFAVQKYSLFCHSLVTFTLICSLGIRFNLFPISVNKKEDLLSVEDILDMLIIAINDTQLNEIIHTKGTHRFISLLAFNIAKLLCLKQINGQLFMLKLLKLKDDDDQLFTRVKVEILHNVSKYNGFNNPFVYSDLPMKKKNVLALQCFISNTKVSTSHNHGTARHRRDYEHQGSFGDAEANEISTFEVYLKHITEKAKQNDFKNDPRLIQIIVNVFRYFEKVLGINYVLKSHLTRIIAEVYTNLSEIFKRPESKINVNDVNLSYVCGQFLLQSVMAPLGFYTLQDLGLIPHILHEELQRPTTDWSNHEWLLFISQAAAAEEGSSVLAIESNTILRKELFQLWNMIDEDCSGSEIPVKEASNRLLRILASLTLSFNGAKALLHESEDGSEVTLTDDCESRPSNLIAVIKNFALNFINCPDFIHHQFGLTVLDIIVANTDSSIYLQHKLNFQETLLQLQADNRVDENSEVIIDECSLLRQKIIEKTYMPGRFQTNLKPTHTFPRPDSTLTRTKPRSRGNGEFTRWLSETRPGLHDHSWLKHARKLYRNSSPDDIKGSTILDLLEQVVKIIPETKSAVKWQNDVDKDVLLGPEDQLAIQYVIRYGAHHRIFQSTQQNIDNLTQLVLIVKTSLNTKLSSFEGFDWFVASSYLLCSGNIEKAQYFLSLMSSLPTAPLLWPHLREASMLAQLGNVLEFIISEEMPALFQVLQRNGLSWWQLCRIWIAQCWWGVLDWCFICHWFTTAILHQPDQLLYFCAALLHSNHERLLQMAHQGTIYEIITNPAEKFQLVEARILIDKLHKKYHSILHSYLVSM